MITIEQCRAARGLLGWTQQDLSEASGLSKTAINNFEKGHSDIKAESLKSIRMALESAGIEFIGMDGLRRKSESMKLLRGENAFADLTEEILHTASDLDEVLASNIGEGREPGFRSKLDDAGLTCRILPQGDEISGMTMIIYGQKVAFELWDRAAILVVASPEASNAERRRFESLWQLAEESGAIPASGNSNATSRRAHGT